VRGAERRASTRQAGQTLAAKRRATAKNERICE